MQSTSTVDEGVEDQGSTAFSDNYDIATNRFKAIVDEHISNMTITDEEICETERLTRGQNKNQLWFDKQRSLLTASNFGKAAKTKVEQCCMLILRRRLFSMASKGRKKLWAFT